MSALLILESMNLWLLLRVVVGMWNHRNVLEKLKFISNSYYVSWKHNTYRYPAPTAYDGYPAPGSAELPIVSNQDIEKRCKTLNKL